MNPNRPIGIFDSGLGGLTVLNRMRSALKTEEYVYYADTKNVPYGDKPVDELKNIALEIVDYLITRNCKHIAFGCNISSVVALKDAQAAHSNINMTGLLSPEFAEVVREESNGRVGVIATTATSKSGGYEGMINNGAPTPVEVTMQACPEFVPLVEAGRLEGSEVDVAVEKALSPLIDAGVDTIIYGCSHYPFLEAPIQEFLNKRGSEIKLLDPAATISKAVRMSMRKKKNNNIRIGTGYVRYVVTGDKQQFKDHLKKLDIHFWDSMVFSPDELDEEKDRID